MNQFPFLIKYPMPKPTNENRSFGDAPQPRKQSTFFTPDVSRFQLKMPRSCYATRTYPYQSREVVTKCRNCSYECCNQEAGPRWSMVLQNPLEGMTDSSEERDHVDQEQFSVHQNLQRTREMAGRIVHLLFQTFIKTGKRLLYT